MLIKLLTKVFSSHNNHTLHQMHKVVNIINAMEPEMEKLSNKELKGKTTEFHAHLEKGKVLENLIPEAFTMVHEASKHVFGIHHFNIQLLSSMVLNKHCITKMHTSEGKTLTTTLPAYLNTLTSKGMHIVTINNYLAQHDTKNNHPLFEFLGLTVSINLPGMPAPAKHKAYTADITYSTNNKYSFDYLHNNMAFSPEEHVQHKLHYALVDKVDSILINEAHTPLIISSPAEDSSEMYKHVNKIIPHLIHQEKEDSKTFQGKGHFSVDKKSRQVNLTKHGLVLIEELLVKEGIMDEGESLYSPANIMLMHHITAALHTHALFTHDINYIIKDGEVIIIDKHTSHTMQGHRWSNGLHQAVEAKEGVQIQNKNQTLASITFQNYFHLYEKLAGMTSTADTKAFKFSSIYKLDTIIVPTNHPMIHKDLPDLVYMTEAEKIQAIIEDIKEHTAKGQPVLVGTISIKKSELVSNKLTKASIKHNILNTKFHTNKAAIVAQAGYPAAVTITTNIAGHGTDIVLSGSWQAEVATLENPTTEQIEKIKANWQVHHNTVLEAGGLHIISTKHHKSHHINNQLHSHSGHQGDAGSSHFYLSMEDALMHIFASNQVSSMIHKLGMKPGKAIEHPWVTKAIANTQHKVESHNFNIHKQLLEYDDMANNQHHAIYSQHNKLLDVSNVSKTINSIHEDVFKATIDAYIPPQSLEEMWDIPGLQEHLKNNFNLNLPIAKWLDKEPELHEETLHEHILAQSIKVYQHKEEVVGAEMMHHFKKGIMLQTLDSLWKEHLAAMDYLHQGIHLHGYTQKDPKQEYKHESFSMFAAMLESLKYEVISTLSKVQVHMPEEVEELEQQHHMEAKHLAQMQQLSHQDDNSAATAALAAQTREHKVGHNNPCPCSSGKKYKQCHGHLQ